MTLSVSVEGVEQLAQAVADVVDEQPHRVANAALDAVTGPSSDWPVATGRSRAGFYVKDLGRGEAVLANTVDYAVYVEGRTDAAYQAVTDALQELG
ncbi:MAG: hypothetical protein OXQ93_13930 [Gemmatimonadota bacterium]|nr:hypothetical protein [Gemmatimonadota bacterium]